VREIGDLKEEQLVQEYRRQVVRAARGPTDFMEELYFTPELAGTLPSREYFEEEPEFEEDL
jgi:hypothetical protein